MILLLGILIVVGVIVGDAMGYQRGKREVQNEAVKRGHAKMESFSAFGMNSECFKWEETK